MSEFKLKNTSGEGTKMFWKYLLAIWHEAGLFDATSTEV
jgi:hypothetical protein